MVPNFTCLSFIKVNETSKQVEESDVFMDIPYNQGSFYQSRGRVFNDLKAVQDFMNLSEYGDTLLVRRRDQRTNAVLWVENFKLRKASSAEIDLAKDRYQERYGVDYDFPRRQIGRRLGSLAIVQNDFLMGTDVYNKDFDELLDQFLSNSSEASPREYNDKTKFSFPISSRNRFNDQAAEDQTRGATAKGLKEKNVQPPRDTSTRVHSYISSHSPSIVSDQSDDGQAKPRRKKVRHVRISAAAHPSKGLKRPLTPYPVETNLPTKKLRMDSISPSRPTELKERLISVLDHMHRTFELDQKTSNLINNLIEEIAASG